MLANSNGNNGSAATNYRDNLTHKQKQVLDAWLKYGDGVRDLDRTITKIAHKTGIPRAEVSVMMRSDMTLGAACHTAYMQNLEAEREQEAVRMQNSFDKLLDRAKDDSRMAVDRLLILRVLRRIHAHIGSLLTPEFDELEAELQQQIESGQM